MDPATGGAITAGGGLLSNAMNLWGQREQRNWQEDMANSAYQRSVADMRAAGLNPSLMFGSGSAANTPNVAAPQFENPLRDLPEALVNSAKLGFEQQRVNNETRVTEAEVARKQAETDNLHRQGPEIDSRTELNRQQAQNLLATIEKIQAEVLNTQASTRSINADLPKKEALAQLYRGVNQLISELKNPNAPPFEKAVQKLLEQVLGPPGSSWTDHLPPEPTNTSPSYRYQPGQAGNLGSLYYWLKGLLKGL